MMFNLNPVDPAPDLASIPAAGNRWESASADFKAMIKKLAFVNQFGTCCYCGFEITSDQSRMPDVEHFAHKGKYGQWACLPANLLLACKYCNQTLKGDYDVIGVINGVYELCQFWLVHPYLDNVGEHIIGGFASLEVDPSFPIPRTLKGARTIRLFDLQSNPRLEEWCRIFDRHQMQKGFTASEMDLFEKAVAELSAYKRPSKF